MAKVRGLTAGCIGLLLAGCAAGGPLAPPNASGVEGPKLMASDGSAVPVTQWGPKKPKAVILALHGYGDHGASTFGSAAEHWADAGITTIAPDQRGFGRNPSRGHWPGADGMIADAAAFAKQIRNRHACAPLIVLGHSMGGGVALAAAAKGVPADGVVLAAPAIWGGDALNPLHRLLAWSVALFLPDERFSGRGVVRIQASDNIEALRALGRDPLYLSPPSAREMLGLVRITDRASDAAATVDLPALMLLGAQDQIVPNRIARSVFDRLNGPKQVVEYPEGWHLLFRDLQAQKVWQDVAKWSLDQPGPDCGSKS
ncbi:MAG: alpha/beta fold hydrolase [Pseudomonadota bacterium]